MIFGNPDYRAISFGGYRGLTREDGPTVEQLVDDVKILAAMDINKCVIDYLFGLLIDIRPPQCKSVD